MERQLFRWQLRDATDALVSDGIRWAWNTAKRAGEDALRDVPGHGMFERVGAPISQGFADPNGSRLGATYAQRWSGPRGTFTVKVMCIRTM